MNTEPRKEERPFFFYTPSNAKRRITICGVVNKETNSLCLGHAVCSPKDNFNRPNGRKVSEGRARKNPVLVLDINTTETPLGKTFYQTAEQIAGSILERFGKKRDRKRK